MSEELNMDPDKIKSSRGKMLWGEELARRTDPEFKALGIWIDGRWYSREEVLRGHRMEPTQADFDKLWADIEYHGEAPGVWMDGRWLTREEIHALASRLDEHSGMWDGPSYQESTGWSLGVLLGIFGVSIGSLAIITLLAWTVCIIVGAILSGEFP
jgi:hypothetical protein